MNNETGLTCCNEFFCSYRQEISPRDSNVSGLGTNSRVSTLCKMYQNVYLMTAQGCSFHII